MMEHNATEMLAMFNSDKDLSYKTVNIYTKDRDEIFYMKPAFLHTKEMPLHIGFLI